MTTFCFKEKFWSIFYGISIFNGTYNTIQYNIKTYNAPYVTKMLFVGAETWKIAAQSEL